MTSALAPPAPPIGSEVAAEHATLRVPTAGPQDRAGAVRAGLFGNAFDCADDIAVLDDGDLVGLVPIELLLAAAQDAPIASIMDADPPVLAPGVDQELVAHEMVRRGESSVAVVHADGTFAGLISPHQMLSVLLLEHDEDLARIGGITAGTGQARRAAQEAVGQRLRHRLPWLVLGLIGAMASAVIVGAFEEQLQRNVLLAIFVPAVVYMADAVGTQTEAVLIRGMAAGVSVRDVIRRELISGVLIGGLMAAAFFPFALAGWGDSQVALAVALALLAACSIATVVAAALPWLFQRTGADPAFGSGPLATVVQDLLSIATYFAIAIPLAT